MQCDQTVLVRFWYVGNISGIKKYITLCGGLSECWLRTVKRV
jgi:hypothetical protein